MLTQFFMNWDVLFGTRVSQTFLPIKSFRTWWKHERVSLPERSSSFHKLFRTLLTSISIAYVQIATALTWVERHVILAVFAAIIFLFFLDARLDLPSHVYILHLFNVDILRALFTGTPFNANGGGLVTVEALYTQTQTSDLF